MKTNYRVIASRTRHEGRIVDQTLCLTNGSSKRYRIYTSEDGGHTESPDNVEAVEFDIPSDVTLVISFIESFWQLETSIVQIERVIQKDMEDTLID